MRWAEKLSKSLVISSRKWKWKLTSSNIVLIDVKEQLAWAVRYGQCRSWRVCTSGLWYSLQHVRSARQLSSCSHTDTHPSTRWALVFCVILFCCCHKRTSWSWPCFFFSRGWGCVANLHDGAVQTDHEDRGADGSLPGSDCKLPQGHSCCQHQLCHLWAHQVGVRSAVKMRNLRKSKETRGANLWVLNLQVWNPTHSVNVRKWRSCLLTCTSESILPGEREESSLKLFIY